MKGVPKVGLTSGGDDVSQTNPVPVEQLNSLVSEYYDHIDLTYVAAGDGAGEIETVIYKDGGSAGTVVATLTLGYNGDNKLNAVTKT